MQCNLSYHTNLINKTSKKMQREDLPSYKQTFLNEMDELRRQQQQ